MHDINTIVDKQVRLRALEPEDADMMFAAESDDSAWRWSDYIAPLSREMLRQYALTYDADPFRAGQLRLIIDLNGEAAGIIDLFAISPRHLRADTGIFILPAFRGKGLATQALLLLKEYSLQRLGLHQLTATVAEQNEAALSIYEKAGFEKIGKLPDWLRTNDGYISATLLSCILNKQFRI